MTDSLALYRLFRLSLPPLLRAGAVASALTLAACSSTPVPTCDQALEDDTEGNAGCMIVRNYAVVMVQQSLTGAWSVPGGTAEEGERSVCTAARETYEETGIKVRVVKKLRVLNNNFHLYHCVEVERTLNQTPEQNAMAPMDALEIRGVAWQTPEQREQLLWRYPAQKELINQLIDQLSKEP